MSPGYAMKKVLLALLIAAAATAQGQTIYKSIDANGNIVYSDTPMEDTLLLETLSLDPEIRDDSPQEQSQARIDQMAVTTERLKSDREDRERLRREEEEQLRARQRAATPPQIYREEYYHDYYPYRNYYPYTGRYPYRHQRPRRPHYPPEMESGRHLNNDAILIPRSKLLTPGTGR